jgi:hypothetical protein
MAGVRAARTEEKIGHFGRDDGEEEEVAPLRKLREG